MFHKRTTSSLVLAALASPSLAQTLTSELIMSMGNNSLFSRWRPYSHFSAPSGWMNDPNGPLYDPNTGLYHMHYQFHPQHVNWGNCSWGHATSPDMIYWTDVNNLPDNGLPAWEDLNPQSIGPTNDTSDHKPLPLYNKYGIWSGTAQPVNIYGQQDGTLLAFYTSISYLPNNWDGPYFPGTESQSIAYSTDGGVTWEQYSGNPVISDAPGNWNITGFRDPYLQPSPTLDALIGYTEPHYYLVFGSGIKWLGARMPLYSAKASDLTSWTFLGALWEPGPNSALGSVFETGSYGYNFECANFFEIDGYWYAGMGTQGGSTSNHTQNWALWNEGILSRRSNGSVAFQPIAGGASDWGLLYASQAFLDTKNNRRIQYGWAWEDMNGFGLVQQGFQGALSLPRVLFPKTTSGLVHDPADTTIGNNVWTYQRNPRTWSARTLGVKPAADVVAGLRKTATHTKHNYAGIPISVDAHVDIASTHILATSSSHAYELRAVITSTTGPVGLRVQMAPDMSEYTTIYYDPADASVSVDRSHSTLISEFFTGTYTGRFVPYTFAANAKTGKAEYVESITMRVFVDGSLIEVFVNDRFALTSRVYPAQESSTGVALYVGSGSTAEFGVVEMWDGLANVWPSRPLNTSSLLVQDTPAMDGNGTWWLGN